MMTGHRSTVLMLFVVILFLRVYSTGKIQAVWNALNGVVSDVTPKAAASGITPKIAPTNLGSK